MPVEVAGRAAAEVRARLGADRGHRLVPDDKTGVEAEADAGRLQQPARHPAQRGAGVLGEEVLAAERAGDAGAQPGVATVEAGGRAVPQRAGRAVPDQGGLVPGEPGGLPGPGPAVRPGRAGRAVGAVVGGGELLDRGDPVGGDDAVRVGERVRGRAVGLQRGVQGGALAAAGVEPQYVDRRSRRRAGGASPARSVSRRRRARSARRRTRARCRCAATARPPRAGCAGSRPAAAAGPAATTRADRRRDAPAR